MAKDLERAFATYNRKYFGGKLPKVAVVWSQIIGRKFDGECDWTVDAKTRKVIPEETVIRIDRKIKRQVCYSEMVLLHEMAHLKLAGKNAKHGKHWQREMHRLARIGAFDKLW